jgi:hypothetical protein
MVLNKI